MSQLPHDIIVDILTYLPAKSLMRFKCVCTPWFSLISDHQFAKMHLNRATEDMDVNRQRLLVATVPPYSVDFEAASDGDDEDSLLQLQYPPDFFCSDDFATGILGSCDGLICLLDENDNMFMWNPSTRDSKELSKPDYVFCGLCFSGLGYDPSTDDYKMVIGSSGFANGSTDTTVELFTLKTNSWRKVQEVHSCASLVGNYDGTFWNGAVHWLAKQDIGGQAEVYVLVSFDIVEGRFHLQPLPDHFRHAELGLSGNSLCIFDERLGSSFEAWRTSTYDVKEPMTKLFSIPIDEYYLSYSRALFVTKKGKLVRDHSGCPAYVELYQPLQKTRKYIRLEHDSDPFYESIIYTESLVSLR